ncbi:hypothetical protein D3C85_1496480 [compost metagenome]
MVRLSALLLILSLITTIMSYNWLCSILRIYMRLYVVLGILCLIAPVVRDNWLCCIGIVYVLLTELIHCTVPPNFLFWQRKFLRA